MARRNPRGLDHLSTGIQMGWTLPLSRSGWVMTNWKLLGPLKNTENILWTSKINQNPKTYCTHTRRMLTAQIPERIIRPEDPVRLEVLSAWTKPSSIVGQCWPRSEAFSIVSTRPPFLSASSQQQDCCTFWLFHAFPRLFLRFSSYFRPGNQDTHPTPPKTSQRTLMMVEFTKSYEFAAGRSTSP